MMTRDDLNDDTFERLLREELVQQLKDIVKFHDPSLESSRVEKQIDAFKMVIAYNSVPGTYEDGNYDL